MFKGLDHFAIAVPDTGEALKIWQQKFGFKLLYAEKVNNNTVLLTHLDLGNTQLQLVEPLLQNSPLAQAVKEKGAHMHHFCLRVNNVEIAMNELNAAEIETATQMHQGTQGKRALFINKTETDNVQVEITGA